VVVVPKPTADVEVSLNIIQYLALVDSVPQVETAKVFVCAAVRLPVAIAPVLQMTLLEGHGLALFTVVPLVLESHTSIAPIEYPEVVEKM
jgi:hypothetical protein